ncbi:unnamed protein product [Brachionus calyciflorus]|uniref:Reverse transcriptase/retrotransposon-derived protein RNase H-like domain-containing protein n=1 Tax=Brachionus calyciflorus TaxID=104777 RepID=A0A813V9U7_9BILA|nr:unnamed protein product [Brachionus calyciflorus]
MGRTQEDHDITLNLVFSRLEKKGFTLYIEICVFSKSTVTFFGLVLSNNSISINEQKTLALKNASTPRNASELHSFLGLTVYASRCIKDLALISEPLSGLLKNQASTKFEWTKKHQASFEKVKNNLIGSVSYFDPMWNTQVTVDASPHGLGEVLTQSHPEDKDKVRIIMYISRILTDTEKRYSQIEKEQLGVVWVCERLALFLLGKYLKLYIDNKAICLIFRNPLANPFMRCIKKVIQTAKIDKNPWREINRISKGLLMNQLNGIGKGQRHVKQNNTNTITSNISLFKKYYGQTSTKDEQLGRRNRSINIKLNVFSEVFMEGEFVENIQEVVEHGHDNNQINMMTNEEENVQAENSRETESTSVGYSLSTVQQSLVNVNALAQELLEISRLNNKNSFEINNDGTINNVPTDNSNDRGSLAIQATIRLYTEKNGPDETEPRKPKRLADKPKPQ